MRSLMSTNPVLMRAAMARARGDVTGENRRSQREVRGMDVIERAPFIAKDFEWQLRHAGERRVAFPSRPAIDRSTISRRGAMHVAPSFKRAPKFNARTTRSSIGICKNDDGIFARKFHDCGRVGPRERARTSRPFSDEPVKITLSTP